MAAQEGRYHSQKWPRPIGLFGMRKGKHVGFSGFVVGFQWFLMAFAWLFLCF